MKNFINEKIANFESKFIERIRLGNEDIVRDIFNKRDSTLSTMFIFIPDRNAKGRLGFKRTISIRTYTANSILAINHEPNLDTDVWGEIDHCTFEGQVYKIACFSFMPRLVWDSKNGHGIYSNADESILPFSIHAKVAKLTSELN